MFTAVLWSTASGARRHNLRNVFANYGSGALRSCKISRTKRFLAFVSLDALGDPDVVATKPRPCCIDHSYNRQTKLLDGMLNEQKKKEPTTTSTWIASLLDRS